MITVVSGTFNRIEYLKRMVASARTSTGGLPIEFSLCDGGSTDGTIEWCKAQPDVRLIEHGELRGAIAAYNDAYHAARGEFCVTANDDIEFMGDTIKRAHEYMQNHPECGQVAFENRGVNGASIFPYYVYGQYLYGQCCMTRRWLGELAGWWGDFSRTYAGDAHLGLRVWEMGYRVDKLAGCAVLDSQAKDALRTINGGDPALAQKRAHPDNVAFAGVWQGRLPGDFARWTEAPDSRLARKAARGELRTLRFKIVPKGWKPRHGMIDAFKAYGPAQQISQEGMKQAGGDLQRAIVKAVADFAPDLVIFQAHGPDFVSVNTVIELRQRNQQTIFANFNGDVHIPLSQFDIDIARVCHVSLLISPDVFGQYQAKGVYNLAYWPISYEPEYATAHRAQYLGGPDVVFLGNRYGLGVFPEAENRHRAVEALRESGLSFSVYGAGWQFPTETTNDSHERNISIYENAKMALSISQASKLWGYTSDRLYWICATGCPALVQQFAGMEEHGFIHGVNCISWGSIGEMVDLARYYAQHDDERETIGRAGLDLVTTRHNWGERVKGLLMMLEDLP